MIFSAATDLYIGTVSYSKAYIGDTQVWPVGPAWPKNYFYPVLDYGRGIGFWVNPISQGTAFKINFASDDCEGEGGWRDYDIQPYNDWRVVWGLDNLMVTATTSGGNIWFQTYSLYDAIYNWRSDGYGSVWNYCTALFIRQQEGNCGAGIYLPTGVSYNNIELLVDVSPTNRGIWRLNEIAALCPNLKYIALNKYGTNTGNTIPLTASTAWTYESMQFTEWYCPGTTFIIENNSWWRSRIDWDIAQQRNITFKDGNGNIITQ